MPLPPIIAWDYLFAPNAQKSRLYLYTTNTPFSICEQPFALPRPTLTDLGITYRRVPVLSIGKDVFPDNASFLEAMQSLLEKEGRALREGPWDRACEAWGYVSGFFVVGGVFVARVLGVALNDRGLLTGWSHTTEKFLAYATLLASRVRNCRISQRPRCTVSCVRSRGFRHLARKCEIGTTSVFTRRGGRLSSRTGGWAVRWRIYSLACRHTCDLDGEVVD
jgi:hypothetical protein